MKHHSPPKLFLRFFRWFCHPKLMKYIEGDLMELYGERVRETGKRKADIKFILDVLLLFRPSIIKPIEGHQNLNAYGMYKSYFKIGWRNLSRSKTHSFINISGLAMGIASCLLISIYLADELSFDTYHEQAEKIHRIVATDWAKMPPALGPELQATYPHLVKETVRLWPLFSPAKMRHDDVVFVESGVVFSDPSVFSVFSWPLIMGNKADALSKKNSIVLTETMAIKYFGTKDPLGAQMKFWGNELTVTGVMRDVPSNSHLQFDFLVSFSTLYNAMGKNLDNNWGMPAFYTYILGNEGVSTADLQAAAQQLFRANFSDPSVAIVLQPLTSIHLNSDLQAEYRPGGNKSYLYILGTAALFILVLASINFANLSTARAATRAKEVGMRTSLGALKRQLIEQFFGEAMITAGVALLLGLTIVGIAFPSFNQLSGKSMTFDTVLSFPFLGGTVLALLLISFCAGAYPALFLSRLKPVASLKGSSIQNSNSVFRKGLIVFQFIVSTFFLAAMLVVLQQLNYLQSKDLGFDSSQIMVLDGDGFPQVQSEFIKIAGVEEIAGVPKLIPGLLPRSPYQIPGFSSDTVNQMLYYGVTPTFVETMGIKILAGRNFVATSKNDEQGAFMINESGARELGWRNVNDALGKPFSILVPPLNGGTEVWRQGTIIGVVEDFHYESLYSKIEPLVLYPSYDLNFTLVRSKNNLAVMDAMEASWKKINPDAPFNYFFLDDRIHQQYKEEVRLGNLIGIATGLTVIIACLGLLGLVAFSTNQRTKEIGIRKVMGASGVQIMSLVTREFIILVSVATLVALPLAFYALNHWISNFAYHIDMSVGLFVLAGITTLAVSIVTVIAQSYKISTALVTESLRSE